MSTTEIPEVHPARVRHLNDRPVNISGEYILYWCQMFRRLRANHALDYAAQLARQLNKPLIIYEGLKLNYPWANARIHTFMLEGMRDNALAARQLNAQYWPFVATSDRDGRGLVRKLCGPACALVTDDYPQFITPAQNRAIARGVRVSATAIDGNGVIPLGLLGPATGAAAHLRPRIHKLFLAHWKLRAVPEHDFAALRQYQQKPPFEVWRVPGDIRAFVKSLPLDQGVPPLTEVVGGSVAARTTLERFVTTKLATYAAERSKPDDPSKNSASRLSPYLHYGHIGIEEVTAKVLDSVEWRPEDINPKTRNKDDFFCRDENVNSYLDEAITWRDVGYQWHMAKLKEAEATHAPESAVSWQNTPAPSFNYATFDFAPAPAGTLETVLPPWARATLDKHATDTREHTYTREEFEAGATHDDLWNAAQREIAATGRIHNYMRMLWGKKVLEWSATPEDGYRTLEYLNNKYAIDGRDPNSYTGLLWIFGLFDRPWPPERQVFGVVRYMTSASTARKFKMKSYLDWVARLPTIAESRAGVAVGAGVAH